MPAAKKTQRMMWGQRFSRGTLNAFTCGWCGGLFGQAFAKASLVAGRDESGMERRLEVVQGGGEGGVVFFLYRGWGLRGRGSAYLVGCGVVGRGGDRMVQLALVVLELGWVDACVGAKGGLGG